MSNTFKGESLKPIAVLTVICVVVAALLAAINTVTGPMIEERKNQAIKESLLLVMPDGEFANESDVLRADAPKTVKGVYTEKNGKGYVVVLSTNKGYTGKEIGLTVAIGTDGKIIKAVITQNEESIVPSNMKPGGSYGDAYKGADADTVADVVTGATVKYTEKAIKNALKDAFDYLDFEISTEKENSQNGGNG
jgi:Na+-translocating ferredoxin:NAD+ oxidoreductase RnfG subunit